MIMDHRPLEAIFKWDIETQYILLCIHQYKMCTEYKPGQNTTLQTAFHDKKNCENKDEKISDMNLSVNTHRDLLDIPECISMQERQNTRIMISYKHW